MNPVGMLNKLRRVGSARWGGPPQVNQAGTPKETITSSSHSTVACDDSISSIETGNSQRVRFCTKEEIHHVENCFSMSPHERASAWYDRGELKRMKAESRQTANLIKSEFKQTLLESLKGCHDQAIFIAELGLVENSGIRDVSSSLLSDLTTWASSSIEGECCRGMEKSLLRRECESFAHDARRTVLLDAASQRDGDDANNIAKTYHSLSRHAVVFAKAIAGADTTAAAYN